MGAVGQGFYSLLRWRSDATRDEAKNVAVLLVAPNEGVGGMRSIPISSVSPRLREQGLVDAIVEELSIRIAEPTGGPELLDELHDSLTRSLYVTEPRPVAVTNVEDALKSLYLAYLHSPRAPRGLTKGVVLDSTVAVLRKRGHTVTRGAELGDFLFDAAVGEGDSETSVLGVLSFASPRKDWAPVLHDAGHFLFAAEHIPVSGLAVIEPPSELSETGARPAFERVSRWIAEADVTTVTPNELADEQQALAV